MDYPTFRPATKPSYKEIKSQRNNFAEHNYNYVNRSKTTKPSNKNTHIHKVKIYHNRLQTQ